MTKSERIATKLNTILKRKPLQPVWLTGACDKCGKIRPVRWLKEERHWMCIQCEKEEECGG